MSLFFFFCFIYYSEEMMKRERERERVCINTKEMRENSFKVWLISQSVVVSSRRRVLLKFFFRKNLLSQTTTEQHNTNTHRTIAFRRDNIHFTRKSNQNQSCLRSTTRW